MHALLGFQKIIYLNLSKRQGMDYRFLALAVTIFYFSLVIINYRNELNIFDYVITIINILGTIISGLIILYVQKLRKTCSK